MYSTDVIIIGAGAAGLMCAIEAGKRGRKVTILEHSNKPGKKILMSGGGRCNFTNYNAAPENYLSQNPHFCKSALSQYTQWDFINLVEKHHLAYYEKTKGQLFCKDKAKDLLNILLAECDKYNVDIQLNAEVINIKQRDNYFILQTHDRTYQCSSLVIATGGLSIPTMGASPFGYKIAEQFGLKVLPTRAGLVPFTYNQEQKDKYAVLAGVAIDCIVTCNNQSFKEAMLFTHRGLSGPSILQISSYWNINQSININFLPDFNFLEFLESNRAELNNKNIGTILTKFLPLKSATDNKTGLPNSFVNIFIDSNLLEAKLKQLNHKQLAEINNILTNFNFKPNGTEGYRTAEVTLGGIDVNQISSKTMQANNIDGLYFIGEVLDVTGWLGGYNFQWAWSSGWVAGQYV